MKSTEAIDGDDWRLLHELQQDALASATELAQRIGLSAQVVRRRRKSLEQAGIISGYRADVDPRKVGLEICAIIRISATAKSFSRLHEVIESSTEVVQCDRTIGADSFIMKVLAPSVEALQQVIDRFMPFGAVSSTIVISSPVKHREMAMAVGET